MTRMGHWWRAYDECVDDPKLCLLTDKQHRAWFNLCCITSQAGGTLPAGPDPTGIGGVVAGFGDQREVELLVEAGFTPLEAIHIATENGARFLQEEDRIGTLAPGKRADLVVVRGDPSSKIADIEAVEIVFKDGVGYDPAKLLHSVRGLVGLRWRSTRARS